MQKSNFLYSAFDLCLHLLLIARRKHCSVFPISRLKSFFLSIKLSLFLHLFWFYLINNFYVINENQWFNYDELHELQYVLILMCACIWKIEEKITHIELLLLLLLFVRNTPHTIQRFSTLIAVCVMCMTLRENVLLLTPLSRRVHRQQIFYCVCEYECCGLLQKSVYKDTQFIDFFSFVVVVVFWISSFKFGGNF